MEQAALVLMHFLLIATTVVVFLTRPIIYPIPSIIGRPTEIGVPRLLECEQNRPTAIYVGETPSKVFPKLDRRREVVFAILDTRPLGQKSGSRSVRRG